MPAVVDKDWVATLLAIALRAERLIFVTDVDAAYGVRRARDATDRIDLSRRCPSSPGRRRGRPRLDGEDGRAF